jgi:multidrug efflux pump subunit AcrA (membrane-fusion protein)
MAFYIKTFFLVNFVVGSMIYVFARDRISPVPGPFTMFLIAVWGNPVAAGKKTEGIEKDESKSRVHEIIISGKLFCLIKRELKVPYDGIITSVKAGPGQRVKAGEVLARYQLTSGVALKLQRKVLVSKVEEMQLNLADLDNKLLELEENYNGLQRLSDHDMASPDSLSRISRDIELLKKKKANVQRKIPVEREFDKKELLIEEELLGKSINQGCIPDEGVLKAPIDGHVIWVSPDFRPKGEVEGGTKVFTIGVLDTMILRAEVHEIEVLQIGLGDVADFILESIPGRTFKATVNRISWETLTPQVDKPSYYDVEFEVENPDFILREGLRGRIILHNS